MSKVLIAYASRFGCTEEVSHKIAGILKNQGVETQVLNLRKTKSKEWPLMKEFDGVLVGSGIKIGKWAKEPKNFLKKHKEELNKKVLGIFVCSGYAAKDPDYARKEYIEKVMEELGVTTDMYEAFGGVFDFSESSTMGFPDRKMLKTAAKGMADEMGITIGDDMKNDFRDWNKIQEFAEKFGALLKG